MRLGILMAGHPPDRLKSAYGDYRDAFARLLDGHGFDCVGYDVEGMRFPDGVHDCDGWLITGSRHGAYEDHAFIPPLERFVRDCVAADVPIVGICFGHQLIAQALGGRVVKYPGGWVAGKRDYDTAAGTLRLNAWHQDQVVARPDGATPIGSSAFCENAILSYGRRAWTIQPHPEFTDDFTADLAEERRDGPYPPGMIDQAIATARRAEGTDSDRIAAAIAAFLKDRAVHAAL
ncbi:type 1 glutamine amidotransferase [Jannaschia sp. LMIT008]|uniref:type 1 glutamine amidotransferase n=1 Tax=Jannaschia maritima TaxID=3032585 RepID=UPI002810EAA5|nr:type 1 glutamine amidotransferase [Jannaschia sp. LMIT008]